MKKLTLKLVTLMLVFTLVCSLTAGSFAWSWNDVGNFFENAGESYADEVEAGAEDLADAYEDLVEGFHGSGDSVFTFAQKCAQLGINFAGLVLGDRKSVV